MGSVKTVEQQGKDPSPGFAQVERTGEQRALHHQTLHRTDEQHGGCLFIEGARQFANFLGATDQRFHALAVAADDIARQQLQGRTGRPLQLVEQDAWHARMIGDEGDLGVEQAFECFQRCTPGRNGRA